MLDKRLDRRVDNMLENGLVQELTQFYDEYYKRYEDLVCSMMTGKYDDPWDHGIFRCIGLKQFLVMGNVFNVYIYCSKL